MSLCFVPQILRSMETRNDFALRVIANLDSMEPWLDYLDASERTLFIEQIAKYGGPLHDRIAFLSYKTTQLTPETNVNDHNYMERFGKEEIKAVKFKNIAVDFKKSLQIYIGDLVAPLFKEIANSKPESKAIVKPEMEQNDESIMCGLFPRPKWMKHGRP